MRAVYMGTPEFAVPPLRALVECGCDIAAVITQPDKPRGRGMKVSGSPVKQAAEKFGIRVEEPLSIRDPSLEHMIRELEPDIIAVAAYGRLLPVSVLEIPPLGCVNIHASLLPKYRGSAPVQRAMLNMEEYTGVTTMYMSKGMDEGDMILRSETRIEDGETAGELTARLADMGAKLLVETLGEIKAGRGAGERQNSADATWAPPITKSMSGIDWNLTAARILRQIYALQPWPVATMICEGVLLRVFSAEEGQRNADVKPGEITAVTPDGIAVACGAGEAVLVKEVQPPGKRRMGAADYLRGRRR